MGNLIASRNPAFFAAGGFAAALFLGGAAHAITDTVFKYSTPQTGYLQIPNTAFVAASASAPIENYDNHLFPTTNTSTCFVAPVNLPHGAKLRRLVFWYQKVNGSQFGIEFLRKRMIDKSIVQLVAFQQLADTGQAYSSAKFTLSDTVDNQRYSYTIYGCANSAGNFLSGARVTYTYINAGD